MDEAIDDAVSEARRRHRLHQHGVALRAPLVGDQISQRLDGAINAAAFGRAHPALVQSDGEADLVHRNDSTEA